MLKKKASNLENCYTYGCTKLKLKRNVEKEKHPNWEIVHQTPSINLSAFYPGTNWPTHLIRKTTKYISKQPNTCPNNQIHVKTTKYISKQNTFQNNQICLTTTKYITKTGKYISKQPKI